MILNIFILILAVEIIAKRPPERPPDGGPIIKYLPDGVDPDGPRMPGGPKGTKKLLIGPDGCIRPGGPFPRPWPRPGGPKGPKGPEGSRPKGMRMRWLPCSLNSCVVR